MQHCRVDHHPVIVEIPHEANRFEVEHLQGAVLACCKEPLVVFLELKSRDVSCMSLEKAFLIDDLAGARLWNLIYLNYIMSCYAQILAIGCHGKLVDLRRRTVNCNLHGRQT